MHWDINIISHAVRKQFINSQIPIATQYRHFPSHWTLPQTSGPFGTNTRTNDVT